MEWMPVQLLLLLRLLLVCDGLAGHTSSPSYFIMIFFKVIAIPVLVFFKTLDLNLDLDDDQLLH